MTYSFLNVAADSALGSEITYMYYNKVLEHASA